MARSDTERSQDAVADNAETCSDGLHVGEETRVDEVGLKSVSFAQETCLSIP